MSNKKLIARLKDWSEGPDTELLIQEAVAALEKKEISLVKDDTIKNKYANLVQKLKTAYSLWGHREYVVIGTALEKLQSDIFK